MTAFGIWAPLSWSKLPSAFPSKGGGIDGFPIEVPLPVTTWAMVISLAILKRWAQVAMYQYRARLQSCEWCVGEEDCRKQRFPIWVLCIHSTSPRRLHLKIPITFCLSMCKALGRHVPKLEQQMYTAKQFKEKKKLNSPLSKIRKPLAPLNS